VLGFEFRVPPDPMSASEPVSDENKDEGWRDDPGKEDREDNKVLWIEVRRRRGKGWDLGR